MLTNRELLGATPDDIWTIIAQLLLCDDIKAFQRMRLALKKSNHGLFSLHTPFKNQAEINAFIEFSLYDFDEVKKYRCISERKWEKVYPFIVKQNFNRIPEENKNRYASLLSAVKLGDLEQLKSLQITVDEIHEKDNKNRTLLSFARAYKHQAILDYFYSLNLAHKNTTNVKFSSFKSPIIYNQPAHEAACLVADMNKLTDQSKKRITKTVFFSQAIKYKRLDIIEKYTDAWMDIAQALITFSCIHKHFDILKFILERTKNLNLNLGHVFHHALKQNNEEMAIYLLENTKIDVNKITGGYSVLCHAASHDMHRVVVALIEQGAKTNLLMGNNKYAEHMPSCLKLKIFLQVKRYMSAFHLNDHDVKELSKWVQNDGDYTKLITILGNSHFVRIPDIIINMDLMKQQHENKNLFIKNNEDTCFDVIQSYAYFLNFNIISCRYHRYGEFGSGIYLTYTDQNQENFLVTYLDKDYLSFSEFFMEVTLYLIMVHFNIPDTSNLSLHNGDYSYNFIILDEQEGTSKINWDIYGHYLKKMGLEPLDNKKFSGISTLPFPAFNGYAHKLNLQNISHQASHSPK